MQPDLLSRYRHSHDYSPDRRAAEKNTRRVIALTAIMMAVEIVAGWKFHSMALLADGWHMSTHVAAFLITAIAYAMARRHKEDRSFSFGTGKIDILGGYTSAILLGIVALFMAGESLRRFASPLAIHYNEADHRLASPAFAVNVVSALLLKHDHGQTGHGHAHSHGPGHGRGQEDMSLKAAYIHVIADAVTSIFAISALAAGKFLGWVWMDPVMGIAGSVVVAQWSWGLLRDTSVILLDRTPETDLNEEILRAVERDADTVVTDLHVWQVGAGKFLRHCLDRVPGAEDAGLLPQPVPRARGTAARHDRNSALSRSDRARLNGLPAAKRPPRPTGGPSGPALPPNRIRRILAKTDLAAEQKTRTGNTRCERPARFGSRRARRHSINGSRPKQELTILAAGYQPKCRPPDDHVPRFPNLRREVFGIPTSGKPKSCTQSGGERSCGRQRGLPALPAERVQQMPLRPGGDPVGPQPGGDHQPSPRPHRPPERARKGGLFRDLFKAFKGERRIERAIAEVGLGPILRWRDVDWNPGATANRSAYFFCAAETVNPITRAPYSSAAMRAVAPYPQPISAIFASGTISRLSSTRRLIRRTAVSGDSRPVNHTP